MFTRKQYIDGKCSHREYYGQFVDDTVFNRLSVHVTKEQIAKSNDDSFNDIPLESWDAILHPFPRYIGDKMRDCGDYPTMCAAVCIAKEAAKQIKDRA